MAKVELKKPVVDEISENHQTAHRLLFWLAIAVLLWRQDTALRKELREAGITYKVYKNTMMKLRIQGYRLRAAFQASGRAECNRYYQKMMRLLRQESFAKFAKTSSDS